MTKFIATLFFASSLFASSTCVPQSGSAKNVQDLNDRACATEQFTVGTGGVTLDTLVITDASNPAKIIAATGSGAYGVALATVAASGTVNVQRYGQVACVMDNNATAGDLVIPGTSTVTDCRDSGQTASSAISTATRIIGVLMTSATAGQTAIVELSPAHFGTLIGNAATATALATLPTPCSTGSAPTGILANGNSTGCASIGGGGTVCKATFNALGGSIASLSVSGCITGVTYAGVGAYTVALSSPPANYAVQCFAGATGVMFEVCTPNQTIPAGTTSFSIQVFEAGTGCCVSHDASYVAVVIQ